MTIDVQELKQKLDAGDDFLLLDVREPYEYQDFNIGGQLVPLGVVAARASEFNDWRDREVVVHCKMGGRSAMAQQILMSNGFTNVRNLTGGVTAWKKAFGQ